MMEFAGLFGALIPVFFVLLLGFLAGRRHSFSAEQAAGLSKLALNFALPASIFVNMASIHRSLLLQQGRLLMALIIVHVGLFMLSWLGLSRVESLKGVSAVLCALFLSTSATPVLGGAVLEPLLGPTSYATVGLVALAINLTVPPAIVLLEMDANPVDGGVPVSKSEQVLNGFWSGVRSPLLWSPILGVLVVILKIPLPKELASSFGMIGSATSGVALFTVGLTLNAHKFHLSRFVVAGAVARITIQMLCFFGLMRWWSIRSPFALGSLICCSFPMATIIVLFASKYKTSESEMGSILLLSTLALVITVPATMFLGHSP